MSETLIGSTCVQGTSQPKTKVHGRITSGQTHRRSASCCVGNKHVRDVEKNTEAVNSDRRAVYVVLSEPCMPAHPLKCRDSTLIVSLDYLDDKAEVAEGRELVPGRRQVVPICTIPKHDITSPDRLETDTHTG
jgi:hypothetical protein